MFVFLNLPQQEYNQVSNESIMCCVVLRNIKIPNSQSIKKIIKNFQTTKMRLHCEFQNCACSMHVGHQDGQCGVCLHGGCWHKNDGPEQFASRRASARTPTMTTKQNINLKRKKKGKQKRRKRSYIEVLAEVLLPSFAVREEPEVPPLPDDACFCECSSKLPV